MRLADAEYRYNQLLFYIKERCPTVYIKTIQTQSEGTFKSLSRYDPKDAEIHLGVLWFREVWDSLGESYNSFGEALLYHNNNYDNYKNVEISDEKFVMMVQTAFHEAEHYHQTVDMFQNLKSTDSNIQEMAVQYMLGKYFVSYYDNNYKNLKQEIDAEKVSLINTRAYIKVQVPEIQDVDACMVYNIKNRKVWCGSKNVFSVDESIEDLDNRYREEFYCQLVLPADVDDETLEGETDLAKQFYRNNELVDKYLDLDFGDRTDFLIKYICSHDDSPYSFYKILNDVLPTRKERIAFRKEYTRDNTWKNMIFYDENQYMEIKNDYGSMAEDKFGSILEAASRNHDGHGGLGE